MNADWNALWDTLDRHAAGSSRARFWLRDDDAVSDTPALRQLADWAARAGAEVMVAVVPAFAGNSLKQALRETPWFIPAIHGWAHKNHAPASEKKQELGTHRPLEDICAELGAARSGIEALCGPCALPVLVPPWNRISPEVVQRLPQLGYSGLSTFADAFTEEPVEGLSVENSHLDLIDWRGTRGGRDHQELIDELIKLIEARTPTGLPIGILSHHLVHDDAAWSFLDKLADVLDSYPRTRWLRPSELFSA
ncbi:MAG: polysaccharide deacetylase [Alphaproteobacteria bacterium]|nr:polysaccharide deacetylase [Alphaproteobacteria bacterium]